MKKLNNKSYNAEVAEKIIELHNLKESHKQSEAEYKKSVEKLTRDIKNFMFVHGIDSLSFELKQLSENGKHQQVVCKQITPVSVIFDAEAVDKKVDKHMSSRIIQKEIVIDDWNGFTKYMKEMGASFKNIKRYISARKTVDRKALENADKLGQISLADLKGCYSVKKSASYLKTEISEKDE